MRIRVPRNATPEEAVALQSKLAPLVSQESFVPEAIRYVAGADGAYRNGKVVGAAVIVEYDSLQSLEVANVNAQVAFPYIPGLLAFREGSVLATAFRKLRKRPDICIVDGHGIAHPRRFGLASYVGLIIDLPTIGVAKSRLCGREIGDRLFDAHGNPIAEVLRLGGKRLYVSVGHKISLEDSVRIVKHCVSKRGLEPILLAHNEAKRLKWSIKN